MAYNIFTKAVLATGLTFAVSSAFAADVPVQSGASDGMLANTCAGCHGTNGNSTGPSAPTIAGYNPEYFKFSMAAFASGEFPSTIMGRIAKGYTEDEIAQMADFYAKQKFIPAKQEFDAAQAKKADKLHDKYCEKCHEDGGASPEDESGFLAGQWAPYLRMQLADYYAGSREPSKKMKKKMEELHEKAGDAGVEALVNYYASKQ
ncbi:MAG: cytochrome c4 [Gammaproteobacteria bacterium]|nr:cytochrome c4 [Gammaproteobacteria bacterium]